MKSTSLCSLALAGFFAFAAPSMAQNAIVVGSLGQQALTTGMVGLTSNQTARLSVLNLNTTPTTTSAFTPPNSCTVELQFFGAQNNSVKQFVVPSFAPQTATSLDLKRSEIIAQTTNPAEIRGLITVNPTPTPVGAPANPGYCSVFVTLQIFDQTTGSTVVFTSDTRSILSGTMIPFTAIR